MGLHIRLGNIRLDLSRCLVQNSQEFGYRGFMGNETAVGTGFSQTATGLLPPGLS